MISFRIYDNVKLIITIPATLNQLKGRFVQALPTTNQPDHVITQLTLAQWTKIDRLLVVNYYT